MIAAGAHHHALLARVCLHSILMLSSRIFLLIGTGAAILLLLTLRYYIQLSNVKTNTQLATSAHFYIQGAYYVPASAEALDPPPFRCSVDSYVSDARLRHNIPSEMCRWSTQLIDCPAGSMPSDFKLVGDSGAEHAHKTTKTVARGLANRLYLERVALIEVALREIEVRQSDTTRRKLVVCFSRMFAYERWQAALAALELYILHGADLLILPIGSVIYELYMVLRAYEKSGNIRLIPATRIPQFASLDYDPNAETEWFNQVLGYSMCLYEYRESDWILNVDIDDIVIPRKFGDLRLEFEQFASAFPLAASFEMLWHTTTVRSSHNPSIYSVEDFVRSNSVPVLAYYGKSAIRPRRIVQAFIHHPMDNQSIISGYSHQTLTHADAQTAHIRILLMERDKHRYKKPGDMYYINSTLYDGLDERFNERLQKNTKGYNAYKRLPRKFYFTTPMHDCYAAISTAIINDTVTKCPGPVLCRVNATEYTPDCMLVEPYYQFTNLSALVRIARPLSQQIVYSETCFI